MKTTSASVSDAMLAFCTEIGRDAMFVQGAGGNVSWKEGAYLHVKASGTWLAEASEQDIFLKVALPALREAMHAGDFATQPRCTEAGTRRPSIETLLHAVMPQRIVAHLHAVNVLAWLVRSDVASILRERVGTAFSWVLVDYAKPGAPLARSVHEALLKQPDAQIVFLKNHGVVIGAESVDEMRARIGLLDALCFTPPMVYADTMASERSTGLFELGYAPVNDAAVQQLAVSPLLFRRLTQEWAIYPDHVVFLGPRPIVYASAAAFEHACAEGETSELVFVQGVGVLSRGVLSRAKMAQLRCFLDVLVRHDAPEKTQVLNAEQIVDLLDWDAERYRQRLAK